MFPDTFSSTCLTFRESLRDIRPFQSRHKFLQTVPNTSRRPRPQAQPENVFEHFERIQKILGQKLPDTTLCETAGVKQ